MRQRIEAEPFFVVAIIAAIRRMLVITAESTTAPVKLDDPGFQATLAELVVLAAVILALAAALRLIPARAPTKE